MFKKSVLVCMLGVCLTAALHAQFSGGFGTENDPYIITTWKELAQIPSYRDRHFKLGNDLDFDNPAHYGGYVKPYNGVWISICVGAQDNSFTGVFDGDNKTIRNIQMSYGLFHTVSGTNSCIKNLNIEGQMNATGETNQSAPKAGSIARTMNNGSIINCESSVNITGGASSLGGLIGSGTANISNCVNRGNITVTTSVMSTL
jgi:hypothetical protein